MNYGQTIVITITAEGDAFEADPDQEVAENLSAIVEHITSMGVSGQGPILDRNGNTCGRVSIMDSKPQFIIGE